MTTFDYLSPDVQGPAYWPALDELRSEGPVTWVESNGGFWAVTSQEAVVRVAQDWETFTSAQGVAVPRPGPEVVPYMAPIELDPPRQRAYRKQVNPTLTARSVAPFEDGIRAVADELIDSFVERGECDLSKDFARKFPGTVFFRLVLGCTDEEFQMVEPWARAISFDVPGTEAWVQALDNLREWSGTVVSAGPERTGASRVVEAVAHLDDTGVAFADHEHASGLQLLIEGGIGTSSSAIGVITRVLCEDPELQSRVRSDPSLIPRLVEECLRLETPLPLMFRTATRDVELYGQRIRKGDKVGLFYGAANRDPAVFDHPSQVDLNRPHERHVAFGAGVHRCIGSNLARLQIRVAVEQLVSRLSPFRIPEGATIEYFTLQARGPSSLPLVFTPSAQGHSLSGALLPKGVRP